METNNNVKKSFNANEVERRTGFSPLTIKELIAEGVTEVTVNAMGRIVVNKGVKLVMWDAPATPAGKLAAQRAIMAAGIKLNGMGVLKAALSVAKVSQGVEKQAPAKVSAPPAVTEADWSDLADAKAAEKNEELLALLDEMAEQAPKKEKKVKREPKPRAPKAK